MYKSEFGLEKYFTILPPNLMYDMCKFRCGSHKLPIEMGRFFSIDRLERICDLCNKEELPMSTYLSSLFINSLKLIVFGTLYKYSGIIFFLSSLKKVQLNR
jgi:hypothetical protein